MLVKYNVKNQVLYIYLLGELDECSSQSSKEAIDKIIDEAKNIRNVVFDFSNLSFMDSTGIGVLLGRYKKIKARGLGIFIKSPTISVEKVLEISGLYKVMPKI